MEIPERLGVSDLWCNAQNWDWKGDIPSTSQRMKHILTEIWALGACED